MDQDVKRGLAASIALTLDGGGENEEVFLLFLLLEWGVVEVQTGLRYWFGASSHLDVIALLLRVIELVVVSMEIYGWAESVDEYDCVR